MSLCAKGVAERAVQRALDRRSQVKEGEKIRPWRLLKWRDTARALRFRPRATV
jgi:hypothetical protein